ncbi:MAG: S1 RNA-binding domain-containing protein, partial [Lachnospiraceae bacterium]|nr:S1 RNA-binding domain-containing protein [Lachnospiraceae bacterium]
KISERRILHYRALLPDVASQTSRLERRADEAEREVEKLKKVEYMEERVGEIFDGVVSGVTSWGMYVELPDTVEGMVHMAELQDDYYIFDEERYQLVGEHTHRTFKLGQKVRVVIAGTDKIMRTIDMRIADIV